MLTIPPHAEPVKHLPGAKRWSGVRLWRVAKFKPPWRKAFRLVFLPNKTSLSQTSGRYPETFPAIVAAMAAPTGFLKALGLPPLP